MDYKPYRKVKRILDIIFSLILIIILSPVFLILIILIWFTMGRPIFFSQLRVGRNKKRFKIFKFRSMVKNARVLELKGKSFRDVITPIGKIMRPLHFDELPQLFNILRGDMSFIGPRPLATWDKQHMVGFSAAVWSLTPGLADMARSLRYNKFLMRRTIKKLFNIDNIDNQNRFNSIAEEYYAEHLSFWLDLKVIWWTVLLEFKNLGNVVSGKQLKKYRRE